MVRYISPQDETYGIRIKEVIMYAKKRLRMLGRYIIANCDHYRSRIVSLIVRYSVFTVPCFTVKVSSMSLLT